MKTTLRLKVRLAGRIIISCLLLFISVYKSTGATPLICPVPANTSLFELNGQSTFCVGDSARYAVAFTAIPVNATFNFYWDSNLDGNADPSEYLQTIQPGPQVPSALFTLEITAPLIGGRILVVYKDQDCPLDSLIRVANVVPIIYNCGARIEDPCTCLNNATSTENGQFSETVVVTSLPGETWEVVSASGLYQLGASVPALPGDQIVPGTILTVGINNFEYELQGVHVDATGYSLIVTNGTDTLSISNRCYYPNPVINLFTDYCINHPAIDLVVAAPPYTGTFSVTINGNPATQFNPALLGLGVHRVAFEFNANPINDTLPGCIQRDTIFVDVFPNYAGGLACTDINVSLLQEGYIKIRPDMVLLGNYRCYSTFIVDIVGKDTDTLFCEDVGQVFMVKITDPIRNNSCWATVTPEDKSAPLFSCRDTTIFCGTDIFALPPDTFISVEDNCDLASVVIIAQGPLTLAACNPDYGASITRTYRATDWMGNSSTCSHTIFFGRPDISEIEAPADVVLNCAPDLDLSPQNLGFPNVNGMPITALCRYSVNYMDMPFITCEGSQTISRMWTVVDVCGGGGIGFAQLIQVIDNVPPVITCPADIALNNSPGLCTAQFTVPAPVITDNCASPGSLSLLVLVNGIPAVPGSVVVLNGGLNTIEYISNDPCNNFSSCMQLVTVLDNEAPTATCNNTTVSLGANGEAVLDVMDLSNMYFDNCAVTEVLIAKMANPLVFGNSVTYDCDEIGLNMLVVQFSDAAGNMNTCMSTVTVQDNLAPTVVFCPADETIECDGSTPPVIEPIFTDNCPGGFTVNYMPEFVPACPNTGVITRTWTATDQMGGTAVCTQVITIVDTEPPVLVCETDVVIELDANGQATISAEQVIISVADACSNVDLNFNPPSYDCSDIGLNILIVTATDECNNATGCAVNVEVADNIAPVFINCNPAADILLSSLPDCDPDTFLDPATFGISAIDNCDLALTIGTGLFQPGSFEDFCENLLTPNQASGIVEFTVSDTEGNVSTCTFGLTVENDVNPVFTTCVENIAIILDANGEASIVQSDVAVAIFPFDCSIIDGTLNLTPDRSLDFTCADALVSPVNVTFTATLCTGNSATCIVEVTVTDNQIPSITCPADITVDCGTSLDVSVTGNAIIDDNCIGGLMLSSTDDLPANINCGILTRTFTATDASDNENTCEQLITIEDNEVPVVTCQNITVFLDAGGNGTADLNSAIVLITDNCTVNDFVILSTNPVFDCADIGPNLFTVNVVDNCGNVGECQITIEVEDDIDPVITTCNNISINFNDAGSCDLIDVIDYIEANLSILDIDATDNCATAFSVVLNLLPGTTNICADPNFPAQATLNYEAVVSDGNGNESSCDFSVAVEYTSAPVFTLCPVLVNVELDNDGIAEFTAAEHVSASDPGLCALPVSYSPVVLIFECGDIGLNPVAVTATICTGASAVCNLTVNVSNPFVPVVTCPGNIVLPSNANCQAFLSPSQITALTPNVVFNCDAAIAINRADGLALTDPFEIGLNVINIVVNLEGVALPVMCNVTVTVEDTTDPVFVNCSPRIIQHSTLTVCNPTDPATYNLLVTDSCDPDPVVSFVSFIDNKEFCVNPDPGLQLYSIEFEVEDVSGNTAVCTLDVTIVNDIDPVFTVCQDISLMVNMAGMTSLDLADVAVAAFNGACDMDFTLNLPSTLNFDCEDVGENNFTAIATLCDGRTASCDFTVTVGQSGEFEVNCPANTTIFCGTDLEDFYAVFLLQFMEMGACVADTTIHIVENINDCGTGIITITFTGIASNGDQVSCETIVSVIIDPNDDFEFADVLWPADFNSNCSDIDPVLTGNPTVLNPLTCSNFEFDFEDVVINPDQNGCEVIERTWTVTEACRNQSQANVQVITRPLPGLPVQSGPPVFTSVNAGVDECESEVMLPIVTGPACSNDIIISNTHNGGGADASGIYPVGITQVVYTLTNSCGEMSTYSVQVEVRDLVTPIATCGSSANGFCSDDLGDLIGLISVSVEEACEVTLDTIITQNLSDCGVGTITVRFVATDQSQNTGTCERVITVSADPTFTFGESDVNFPSDIDLPCNGIATTDITGIPEILTQSFCSNISMTFNDITTADPGTGCTTIERTWTILEECTNVTVEDVQVITIASPGIEIDGMVTVFNMDAPSDACEAQVDIPLLSVLGCAGGVTIFNNSPYADSPGADASGVYPVGTTNFQFTVTNNCGGMGTIQITVNVFDVTPPVFNCPDTEPLICTGNILAYVSTLEINATDACGISNTQAIIMAPDFDCGNGVLPIEFRVTDFNGNIGTCEVNLAFLPDLIEESDIIWPADYFLSCNENTNPVTTGLVLFEPNCSDLVNSFIDGPISVDPSGCPVFTRFWTVTDNCQVEPGVPGSGVFTYQQLIYPANYSEIMALVRNDRLIPATAGANCQAFVNVSFPLPDYCAPDVVVENTFTANGADASGFYPVGVTVVTYTISNNCGLLFTEEVIVNVEDLISPSVLCSDLPSSLPCTADLDAIIDSWVYVVTETCPHDTIITVDKSGLSNCGVGTLNVTLEIVDIGNNGASCTRSIQITPGVQIFNPNDIVWPDPVITLNDCEEPATPVALNSFPGLSTPYNCLNINFTFEDETPNPPIDVENCVEIERTWTATNLCSGAIVGTFVQLILINANLSPIIVGGKITDNSDAGPMNAAIINISDSRIAMSVMTNHSGKFNFGVSPSEESVRIQPLATYKRKNRVNAIDLNLLIQHLYGGLKMQEPWRRVAADVDKSGVLNDDDLFEIRALILGEISQFRTGNWKFIPSSVTDSLNGANDWMNIPEYIDVPLTGSAVMNRNDFKAVELGKLYTQIISQIRERDVASAHKWIMMDQSLKMEQSEVIPVFADRAGGLKAFQFTLNWNPGELNVVEILPGKGLSLQNFSTRFSADGKLTVCWAGERGKLADGEAVFSLVVISKQHVNSLTNLFEITHDITDALAYFGDDHVEIPVLGIQYSTSKGTNDYELFQNSPNPFSRETWVSFRIPSDEMVTISVTDLSGKIIHQQKQYCLKGKHAVKIDLDTELMEGMYLYRIETNAFSATKKMLKVGE